MMVAKKEREKESERVLDEAKKGERNAMQEKKNTESKN